jgi:hypothetical protein
METAPKCSDKSARNRVRSEHSTRKTQTLALVDGEKQTSAKTKTRPHTCRHATPAPRSARNERHTPTATRTRSKRQAQHAERTAGTACATGKAEGHAVRSKCALRAPGAQQALAQAFPGSPAAGASLARALLRWNTSSGATSHLREQALRGCGRGVFMARKRAKVENGRLTLSAPRKSGPGLLICHHE